ncbi:MAG: DUF1588 domain-containing protein [Polyangiaceae bacterium]|nr:DUF1588 domain-containing protein [Polyangiaceae bacterium]
MSGLDTSETRKRTRRKLGAVLAAAALFAVGATAPGCTSDEVTAAQACAETRQLFAEQVWPILNAKCTGCHAPGGSAATGDNPKSRAAAFVLEWDAYPDFLDVNLDQVSRMVSEQIDGVPKFLVKPTGGDTHVGGAVIGKDSAEYKLFEQLAKQVQATAGTCGGTIVDPLAGVEVDGWATTFRRAAIILGGRLPADGEKGISDEASFDKALDALMTEPGFMRHVKESWNDVLLTNAGGDVQVGPFQFRLEDFPAMSVWRDGPDPQCAFKPDYDQCVYEYYTHWGTVRDALIEEPLALIANVVQKNAPFSEILTADYTMANPWSAIAYNAANQFPAPTYDNFGEWKEIKVVGNERGPVPHAGVLTTPAFLGRWVSTETNKNRARARMVYKAFLATNVLALAQRPVDTTALTGIANPTRNAPACAVCHTLIDPVATSFSNYSDTANFDYDPEITAATIPHQEMLPPGFGTERIAGQESALLPALVKMVTTDSRFALSVSQVAYKGIMGREVLRYPDDPADPAFKEKLAAWDAQDKFLHSLAEVFRTSGENYKEIIRAIVKSAFFRFKGTEVGNPQLALEIGAGRLLPPEILDRKIEAAAGIPWSIGGWGSKGQRPHDLYERYMILYGGIDSLAVTTRLTSANPLVANISERMANEIACRTVAFEFTQPAESRTLLKGVERDTTPENGEAKIRATIVELFERALGETHGPDDPEIDAAYAIFRDTYQEISTAGDAWYLPWDCLGIWNRKSSQIYSCGTPGWLDYDPTCYAFDEELPEGQKIDHDDKYTIGPWMAVVAYIFSDVRFIYE